MNIVVYTNRGGKPRSLHIGGALQAGLLLSVSLFLVGGLALGGYLIGAHSSPEDYVVEWRGKIDAQRSQLDQVRGQAESDLNALAGRLGRLQGHITRVDALGSRLLAMADIDSKEFNFTHSPAMGGPSDTLADSQINLDTLERSIMALEAELKSRSSQLAVLENVLSDENLKQEVYPAGRPVQQGWLSSYYGWRTNPFGGNQQFHKGVDFAGKEDSEIVAVGGGVVTYSGKRYGYGNLVEITHGNGYTTRYGHNKTNLVREGEAVKKGQPIALMGSTGRSTGPHVHFEVIKDGKKIDPARFIALN
jgi:hypothetical protein